MATNTTISQEAVKIGPFKWTEGDPVDLRWWVDADWSGTYRAQVRKKRSVSSPLIASFTVTATYDGGTSRTLFQMVMDETESAKVTQGKYFTDVQEVNGRTRVWGLVVVGPQVTEDL